MGLEKMCRYACPEGEGSKPFSPRDKGTLEAEQKGWDEGSF
jgi:hypothetical protein